MELDQLNTGDYVLVLEDSRIVIGALDSYKKPYVKLKHSLERFSNHLTYTFSKERLTSLGLSSGMIDEILRKLDEGKGVEIAANSN